MKPYKIALMGTKDYANTRLVKETLFKIKQQYKEEPVEILGAGGNIDINKKIRNYALEFGFTYKEYNPSYTGRNNYSAMAKSYYDKAYHPSHVHHSLTMMSRVADAMVIFKGQDELGTCEIAYKQMNKLNKKVAIL